MGFVLNFNAFMGLKFQFQTERKTLTTSKRKKDNTNRFIKKSGPRETDKLTYILSRNKEVIGEYTDKRKRKPKLNNGHIKRM